MELSHMCLSDISCLAELSRQLRVDFEEIYEALSCRESYATSIFCPSFKVTIAFLKSGVLPT
jgi:hypothetical protein